MPGVALGWDRVAGRCAAVDLLGAAVGVAPGWRVAAWCRARLGAVAVRDGTGLAAGVRAGRTCLCDFGARFGVAVTTMTFSRAVGAGVFVIATSFGVAVGAAVCDEPHPATAASRAAEGIRRRQE